MRSLKLFSGMFLCCIALFFCYAEDQSLWFQEFFPDTLINASGKRIPISTLKGKMVGVYFSASWCGPCRGFTPQLVKFYRQTAKKNNLEIVFVSLDRTSNAMMQYMKKDSMSWLAVPFGDPSGTNLKRRLLVGGIPSFAILSSDGKVISYNARWDVVMLKTKAVEAWRSPDYKPLTYNDYKNPRRQKNTLSSKVQKSTAFSPAPSENEKDATAWLPGPTEQWHVRMDTALNAAQKEHKKIYVLITGSDWCGFCKKLYRDVLSTEEFIHLAKEKMILVYLDKPVRKNMPATQKIYNEAIYKEMCHRVGGVPNACVFDEDGRWLGNVSGSHPKPKYMAALHKLLESEADNFKAQLPPEWVRKSPEQLKPMLERLSTEKKQAVERAAEAAKILKQNSTFQIVAWGTDKNEVNRPFDSRKEIRLSIKTKFWLNVKYSLPQNIRTLLSLRFVPSHTSGFYGGLSGNGEIYIGFTPRKPGRQNKLLIQICPQMPECRSFTALELPCNVIWEKGNAFQ